jgi:hypothetical protein
MKKEFKPLSWVCQIFDFNAQEIRYYDILKYREDDVKKMKKKSATKEEFEELLKREMMRRYWSKCEWELIIQSTADGHIWLKPWVGCREPAKVCIDVTDREDFDWKGFAERFIDKRYGNEEKIDVYDQLSYVWDEFVDYVWNYRHKYQRKNLGGARRDGD